MKTWKAISLSEVRPGMTFVTSVTGPKYLVESLTFRESSSPVMVVRDIHTNDTYTWEVTERRLDAQYMIEVEDEN